MKEQIYTVKVNEYGTFWYKDPECQILHRDNGPAVEYSNGDKAYWINGRRYSEKEYWKYVKYNI